MSKHEDRLSAIEARLAALEQRLAPTSAPPPQAGVKLSFDLVNELRERSGPSYQGDGMSGALRYAGAVQMGGGEVLWEIERPAPWLATLDAAAIAPVLAALGSVPRLLIARALLSGPRTSQQLQEVLGVASPGQLYHHLKELIAAGIIEQHGRGDYRVAVQKIVPLLVAFAVAAELGDYKQTES